MKTLNKTENIIFIIGALLMVVGSGANLFFAPWAPYLFAVGTLAFSLMQFKQKYEGDNFVIRRLRRMQLISDTLFLLAALFLFLDHVRLFPIDYLAYIHYVHNNWVVLVLIGAILQLYSTHRIASELRKTQK
ncbi:MAG: hypothetical protein ACI4BA_08915 [Prevotella sp.]